MTLVTHSILLIVRMIKITGEQQDVIKKLIKFPKQVQTLGGYAGTGKTVCFKFLHTHLKTFAACAFTGKASHILRRRGVEDACTIHKLIYRPVLDEQGYPIINKDGMPVWEKVETLPYDGILVDEASMVSRQLHEDLMSYGLPIIYFGDHGQLEPVGEAVNLMKSPDYRLEKIHRNAGPIAHFAEYIRKGFRPAAFDGKSDKVQFVTPTQAKNLILEKDHKNFQAVCAFNAFRCGGNQFYRTNKNMDPDRPQVGDKVICLRNDYTAGVFNGMQGFVTKTYKSPPNKFDLEVDGDTISGLQYFTPQFYKPKLLEIDRTSKVIPFDYSYLQTVHKMQGDEVEELLVFEQKCDLWDHVRWAYTAASRGKEQIYWSERNVSF